jgi:hypothetical protein
MINPEPAGVVSPRRKPIVTKHGCGHPSLAYLPEHWGGPGVERANPTPLSDCLEFAKTHPPTPDKRESGRVEKKERKIMGKQGTITTGKPRPPAPCKVEAHRILIHKEEKNRPC